MYYTEDGELREDRSLVYHKRKSFIRKIPVVKDMRLRSSKKSLQYTHYRDEQEDIYAVPHKHSKATSSNAPTLLSCPVCMEAYTPDDKQLAICRAPLFLNCHHTVCKACLPRLIKSPYKPHKDYIGEVSCPQCRHATQVPQSGLSVNFYILTLLQKADVTATYTSSRLMMWCEDCQNIAEDCCHDHQVTRLSHVLGKLDETVQKETYAIEGKLKNAEQQERDLTELLKEAIDGLDRASQTLRVKLQNHLELVTMKHGTTASLLEQLDNLSLNGSIGASSAPPLPPRNSMHIISETHESSSSPSQNESNIYPELPNLTVQSNPLSPDSFSRSRSLDSGLVETTNNMSQLKNNNLTANRRTSQIAKLSSFQQEQRIIKLKSNMATLKQIGMSIEEQKSRSLTLTSTTDNNEDAYLTIDEVKILLNNAIDAINVSMSSII